MITFGVGKSRLAPTGFFRLRFIFLDSRFISSIAFSIRSSKLNFFPLFLVEGSNDVILRFKGSLDF